MIPLRSFRTPSLILGLYLLAVGIGVYAFRGMFNPVLVGVILSACGLTVYSVYYMVSRAMAQQTPAAKEERTQSAPASGRKADPEIDSVKELLSTANRRLAESKKVASLRARTTVDQLPLFILMGLEGTGKTSTFAQSGLEPELLAGQVFRENQITPTPSCNLWLADGAIFAELAGNFLSGDTDRFSRLLKLFRTGGLSALARFWRRRKSQNLRGVVLCCDVATILGVPNPALQTAQSRLLQERLRAIGEVFACDFPVYVIFTKADRIKYFGEYFARLTKEEHRQVLGCGLNRAQGEAANYSDDSESKRLASSLNRLYFSLAEKRPMLLARESDPVPRLRAYEFPREVKRFRGNLVQFLVETFRPNPLNPGPLLRGFYFTGIRQVSPEEPGDQQAGRRPIDNPTQVFDREQTKQFLEAKTKGASAVVPRWAFTWELFSQAVLGDRASARSYGNVRLDWYRRIAFGAGIAVVAVFGFLTVNSWNHTRGFFNTIQDAVDRLPKAVPTRSEVLDRLPSLERLRDQLSKLRQYDDSNMDWYPVGLYPGTKLYADARNFYFRQFGRYLLSDPPVAIFKKELQGLPVATTDALPFDVVYNELKGYLSITSQACLPDADYLTKVWQRGNLPAGEANLVIVGRQFEFFEKERKAGLVPIGMAADPNVVAAGRGYLEHFDRFERIYRNLVDGVPPNIKAVRLEDYSPHYQDVFKPLREVRAAFSKPGAEWILKQISSGNWSLNQCIELKSGNEAAGNENAIKQQLRDRYANEYIDAWRRFLESIAVVPYPNAHVATVKLDTLADKASPILTALFMTHENTSWAENPGTDTTLRVIETAFQPVHSVIPKSSDRNSVIGPENGPYVKALQNLRDATDRLDSQKNDANMVAAQDALRNGQRNVKEIAYGFHARDVEKETTHVLFEPLQAAVFLKDSDISGLKTAVTGLCQSLKKLQNKHPFLPEAKEFVQEKELSAFFSPTIGSLWKFEKEHLESSIERRGSHWAAKSGGAESAAKVSGALIEWFDRLARISAALFSQDADKPGMRYTIKVEMPDNVNQLQFNAGDGVHAPGEYKLQWPGNDPRFRLDVTPGARMADWSGMWSLFDMAAHTEHPREGQLDLNCNFAPGSGSSCSPVSGKDNKDVIVHIQVVQPPNGVEGSLDKNFLNLKSLKCPAF